MRIKEGRLNTLLAMKPDGHSCALLRKYPCTAAKWANRLWHSIS